MGSGKKKGYYGYWDCSSVWDRLSNNFRTGNTQASQSCSRFRENGRLNMPESQLGLSPSLNQLYFEWKRPLVTLFAQELCPLMLTSSLHLTVLVLTVCSLSVNSPNYTLHCCCSRQKTSLPPGLLYVTFWQHRQSVGYLNYLRQTGRKVNSTKWLPDCNEHHKRTCLLLTSEDCKRTFHPDNWLPVLYCSSAL